MRIIYVYYFNLFKCKFKFGLKFKLLHYSQYGSSELGCTDWVAIRGDRVESSELRKNKEAGTEGKEQGVESSGLRGVGGW